MITDFLGSEWKEMLGKKCERCHEPFNPHWSDEDNLERDNCEECSKIIEDNEQEIANR